MTRAPLTRPPLTPASLHPAVSTRHPLALSDAQFRRIGELVTGTAGIQLRAGKENLVRARVAKRLRALVLPTVQDYLDLIDRDASGRERAELVDVLTTNTTAFFREPAHFFLLQQTVLPALARGGAPIRIWSAGCSTGEEPYSIAMVVRDSLGAAAARVSILATDISDRVLARARAAEYPEAAVAGVPIHLRHAHLERVPEATGRVRIARATRTLVRFESRNLMDPWPSQGSCDVIFCRNVMIYFDKQTQERLVARLAALLPPGGLLMLGHSESLRGVRHGLAYVQPATYQRPLEGVEPSASTPPSTSAEGTRRRLL